MAHGQTPAPASAASSKRWQARGLTPFPCGPSQLTPLFAIGEEPVRHRPAHGAAAQKALHLPPGVGEPRVIDLLWHTPTGVIDRRATPTVAEAVPGTIATLEVRVLKHKPSPRGNTRAPYKVTCEDDSGRIDLVFFHADRRFIERQLPTGPCAPSAAASRATTTRSR